MKYLKFSLECGYTIYKKLSYRTLNLIGNQAYTTLGPLKIRNSFCGFDFSYVMLSQMCVS